MATCQHANTEDRRPLRPGEQPDWDIICGQEATEWRLPNGTTGFYCGNHGPDVVRRVQRRLDQEKGGSHAG